MKVQKYKMDTGSVIDFTMLILLIVSAIIYVEFSTDFQNMMEDIKYNSIAGINEGIAALNSGK